MMYDEAMKLKVGDLVIVDDRNKHYGGLILEIEKVDTSVDYYCRRVTLKQPGFDSKFRIEDYDSRRLKKYEL